MTEGSQAAKEILISIEMDEGEPLGAIPNDKMIITKVQPGTLAEGKLQVGDQVLRVNDSTIRDANHFFHLLRYAPPCAKLMIYRDEKKAEEVMSRVHIPPERERFITRRDGYSYELAKLSWVAGGAKLGLGIKHYQNRVLVSKADAGSISAESLKVGDHIVDVDSTPVTDKDVARRLIVNALQQRGTCTMVIERPETMEAKHWVQNALSEKATPMPSVQMNSDVRDIAQRERERIQKKLWKQPKSILVSGRHAQSCQVSDDKKEHIIVSDNEGKALRSGMSVNDEVVEM